MSLVFVLFWYSKPERGKDGCHAPLRPNACAPCTPVNNVTLCTHSPPQGSTFEGIPSPAAHRRALSRMVTAVTSQGKEESEVRVKARLCTEQQPPRHPPASRVRDCFVPGGHVALLQVEQIFQKSNPAPSHQSRASVCQGETWAVLVLCKSLGCKPSAPGEIHH